MIPEQLMDELNIPNIHADTEKKRKDEKVAWQQRAVLLTGEEFLQTQLDFRAAGQAAADRAKQLKEARLNREAVLRMRIKENEEKNLKRVDALKEKLQAEKADHKATKAKKKAIEAQLRLVIKEKEDLIFRFSSCSFSNASSYSFFF